MERVLSGAGVVWGSVWGVMWIREVCLSLGIRVFLVRSVGDNFYVWNCSGGIVIYGFLF